MMRRLSFGPLHGVVMRVHVRAAFVARGIKRRLPIQQDALQDRETEAPRTGMDQDIGMVAVEPRLRGDVRLEDFLDGLEFAEVVAAADAAKRGIKGGGVKDRRRSGRCRCRRPTADRARATARPVGRAAACAQRYRAQTGPCRSRCRSRPVAGECDQPERRSRPGPYLPGWRSGMAATARTPGDPATCLELKRGVTLDPGFGRGEDVDRRAAVHLGRKCPLKSFSGDLRIVDATQRRHR